jgi:hypothetical protein
MATRYEARWDTDDTAETVRARYRKLADATMCCAGTRLRHGAPSRAVPQAMLDALLATGVTSVITRKLHR